MEAPKVPWNESHPGSEYTHLAPPVIEHAILSSWEGVEAFLANRERRFGVIPNTALETLQRAAEGSEYQDNELNTHPSGKPGPSDKKSEYDGKWYTKYVICIEGPIQEGTE